MSAVSRTAKYAERISDSDKIFTVYNIKLAKWFLKKAGISEKDQKYEDLLQACIIGLICSRQKFDSKKGKFSTYAFHWMKQSFIEEYRFVTQIVDINSDQIKYSKYRRNIRKIRLESFESFTNEKRLRGTEYEDICRIQFKKVDSLDGSRFKRHGVDGTKYHSYHDVLEDENAINPEEFTIERNTYSIAKKIFEDECEAQNERYRKLNKERNVKSVMFEHIHGVSLRNCAKKMFHSKQAFNMMKKKILRKTRHRFRIEYSR